MNSYIVSFSPGASGRLIANLIYGLLSEVDYSPSYILTDINSTHNFSPYATTYKLTEPRPLYGTEDVYEKFNFIKYPAVIPLHTYPKFEVIQQRFPNSKIVIITIKEQDLLEITGNSVIKNSLYIFANKKHQPAKARIEYIEKHLRMLSTDSLNIRDWNTNDKKIMINAYYTTARDNLMKSNFFNPVIPESFYDKVLLLPYSDIYSNSQAVLDNISNFINRPIKNSIVDLYKNYLEGREKLIEAHMPWLKSEYD